MNELLGVLAIVGSGVQITLTAKMVAVDIGCQPMIRVAEPLLDYRLITDALATALTRAAEEVVARYQNRDDRPLGITELQRALSKTTNASQGSNPGHNAETAK